MSEKFVKQLEKAVEAQDEGKTSNLVERILSLEPTHTYALHCKAVLTMHQGKHQVALAVLEQLAEVDASYQSDQEFLFQKGYCLYRLQRFAEAREALKDVLFVPAQHLLAQIAYNLEEYEEAAAIYEALLANNSARDDQERQEIITNLSAAYVTLDAKKAADAVRRADEKTADMLFNAATAELEGRQYDQALATLNKAELLVAREHGTSTLKSFAEFSAAEVLAPKSTERALFEELSPIWVQRAYLHYTRGDEDASANILATVLKHRVASVAVGAVASINWAAIKRHKDFFDTYRKLKQVQSPAMLARLTTKQKLLVRYNTAMLLLNIGKLAACKQVAESLISEHPNSELGPTLLLAANVRAEAGKKQRTASSKIEELLMSLSNKRGGGSRALQSRLTVAQIRLEQGDLSGCISELKEIDGISTRIGFVTTAAAWLIRAGEFEHAVQLVRGAVKSLNSDTSRKLTIWMARTLLQCGEHVHAASLFDATDLKAADDEVKSLAVLAHARSNMDRASAIGKELPSSSSSAASDIDALLSMLPNRTAVEAVGFKRTGDEEQGSGKEVKRRQRSMRRPPKNLNKDARPDPERWLPMSIRPSVKDMPERRKKELRRLRAADQEEKRKAAEKRKQAAAAASSA